MEQTLASIQDFLSTTYVWATLAVLSFLGITDWIKNLILEFLKEKGRSFIDLINDKALRGSFYTWSRKNYRRLPPWAKKLSKWLEGILNSIGIRTRRRGGRRKKE